MCVCVFINKNYKSNGGLLDGSVGIQWANDVILMSESIIEVKISILKNNVVFSTTF